MIYVILQDYTKKQYSFSKAQVHVRSYPRKGRIVQGYAQERSHLGHTDVPKPGEHIMIDGTWAKVLRHEGNTVIAKLAYDMINQCPDGVDPNWEYRLDFQKAAEAKQRMLSWERFYLKEFFEASPIAKPKDEIEKHIMEVEQAKLRYKNNTEHAYCFDSKGNKVLEKAGTEANVFFTYQEKRKLFGVIVTHNHPVEAGSFSEDDVKFAFECGLAELRAVTNTYLFVLRPPKGMKTFPQDQVLAMKLCQKAQKESYDGMAKKIDTGQVNTSDMNEVGWDDTWRILAKNTGLQYEKFRWADAKPRKEGGYGTA